MTTFAVIVAAGQGTRFSKSHSLPKQYFPIEGIPMWVHAVKPFEKADFINHILVVCPEEDILKLQLEVSRYSLTKVLSIISGGKRRQDSVWAAIEWIKNHKYPCDFIFVHDGVRPFVSLALIERIWNKREHKAIIPVLPIFDTIKRIKDEWVEKTIDRSQLIRVQTPQLFSYFLLDEGFQWLEKHPMAITDEASMVEQMGKKVKVIEGEESNIKITVLEDLEGIRGFAPQDDKCFVQDGKRFVQDDAGQFQVGQGIDVHAFEEGNKIILGGIKIPCSKKIKGHSDADVLVHAVCDSLLGAVGLSDIGTYFPDTDPQYKDISSLILLEKVVDKVNANHYTIGHVDATVAAEMPKLAPYIPEMKICLAKVMRILPSQISIKATTCEGLGFIGRKEGIAALAISTVRKSFHE